MKVVDLNLLLYAVNADAPEHASARAWWESALNGEEQVGLAWAVVLGFLRLGTRRGVLPRPMAPARALDVVAEWVAHPLVTLLHPGDGHWEILRGLLDATGTGGNLTTDAHLAALALEYDAALYSTDRDFARFRSLRLVNPIA
jgi:toxin-antitoxin system PIN domain toxin